MVLLRHLYYLRHLFLGRDSSSSTSPLSSPLCISIIPCKAFPTSSVAAVHACQSTAAHWPHQVNMISTVNIPFFPPLRNVSQSPL